jgi:outer membrane protein assembly factor BamB
MRRSALGLSFGAIFFFTCLLPGPLAQTSPSATWPGWGGPDRNFSTTPQKLASSWPSDGPPKLWTRPLGEGHSAVVADRNRLFTMYRPSSGVKNQWKPEEVIVGLDAASGRTLWEHRYPSSTEGMDFTRGAGPHSTPLVVEDRVFAVSSDKQLFALDAATGKLLWSHHLVKEFGAPPNQMRYAVPPGYAPSPIAYKETLITMVGGPNQGVIAFRQDDGRVAWKAGDFPDDIAPSSPILITLDGQDQLVVTSGDGVHGMDPSNGRVLWTFAFPTKYGANMTTPLWSPTDRLLFLSAAYEGRTRVLELVRAGERTEARERWSTTRMRVMFTNVIRIGDHYYGSSGDFGPAFLTAVHARTGEISWQDRSFSKVTLVRLGDNAILLDEDGMLALARLAPDKLTVVSKSRVAAATSWTVPTVVGTRLYLRDRVNIMAFDIG